MTDMTQYQTVTDADTQLRDGTIKLRFRQDTRELVT